MQLLAEYCRVLVNNWFWVGLAVAFVLRFFGGQIVSLVAGMACGCMLNSMWRFLVWAVRR